MAVAEQFDVEAFIKQWTGLWDSYVLSGPNTGDVLIARLPKVWRDLSPLPSFGVDGSINLYAWTGRYRSVMFIGWRLPAFTA